MTMCVFTISTGIYKYNECGTIHKVKEQAHQLLDQ